MARSTSLQIGSPKSHLWKIVGFLALGVVSGCNVAVHADVQLHPLFSDHAVLQQGRRVPVWGWADPKEAVTVQFGDRTVHTVTDESGHWMAWLPSLSATAEGRTLVVRGKNVVQREHVVVGEVWLGSGQSNMQWALTQTHEAEVAIQSSANPNLRLFTVQRRRSEVPLDNFQDPETHLWTPCTPESVRSFSAVGYYFGRDLQAALQVPVGIIHCSWGGSPAEVWMDRELLAENPRWDRQFLRPWREQLEAHKTAVAAWETEKAAAETAGESFDKGRPGMGWQPGELYNAMLHPVLPYAVSGVIWYQGESNASRAWQYRQLFTDLIQNWRMDWGQGNFPFLAVQLAPWDKNRKRELSAILEKPTDSDWAELREAQNYAASRLPQVAVAVITDVGDKDDIHPMKKEPVGARLALLARQMAYGDQVLARGPEWTGMRRDKEKVVLTFESVGDGLKTLDGEAPTGFAVAGEDKVFHWAKAEIHSGREVHLSSETVKEPVAVRYGWSDFPVVNLANSSGLPASPFRTDGWPATTDRRNQD